MHRRNDGHTHVLQGKVSAAIAAHLALALLATWWQLFRSVQSPLPALSTPARSGSIPTPAGERTYTAFIPAHLASNPALLIVLHGSRGSADQMRRYAGQEFERLADEHGFIVVHPDGTVATGTMPAAWGASTPRK